MLDWLSTCWTRIKEFVDRYIDPVINIIRDNVRGVVDWLRGRVESVWAQVTNWIGQVWDGIRDAANQAWSNVITYFSAAKAYALELWNNIKDNATNLFNHAISVINDIKNWFVSVINDKMSWVTGVFTELRNRIDAAMRPVTDWASGVISDVKAWVSGIISDVRAGVDNARAFAQQLFDTVKGEIQTIVTLPASFSASFIWSIIEAYIFPWVEWWLAYHLYSGEGPLPEKPTLPGGSGGPGTGYLPPGGVSALGFSWPTASRYISGYIFNEVHKGVDIGISMGDPIMAIQDGTVVNAGWSTVGYGYMVKVAHSGGWYSLYAHLLNPVVSVGQFVYQGQVIGIGDSTGHSTGPHLHLEIFNGGNYFDPLTLLP